MTSWFSRLKDGLKKSSATITDSITSLVLKRKLDQETLDGLEETLIQADLGVQTSHDLVKKLAKSRFDQDISDLEVREFLAAEIETLLTPFEAPLKPEGHKPYVVMMVGVNGSGKTTSMGKLAALWQQQGYKIMVVACDTFRAAAVEQLDVWAKRANVTMVRGAANSDAASLAYDAIKQATAENYDVVMIDTAGRLQNKAHLMDELRKMSRVIDKAMPGAPHATILVLDATTGQNAHTQVALFKEAAPLSSMIMTKLDGTARGGVVVALTAAFNLPVCAIGIGEHIDDLRPFDAKSFAKSLMGLDV